MSDCLFCRIVAREIPAQLVFEDAESVAFKDVNPQAPTHVLIVPKSTWPAPRGRRATETPPSLGHLQRVSARGWRQQWGLESFRLVANNGRGAGAVRGPFALSSSGRPRDEVASGMNR